MDNLYVGNLSWDCTEDQLNELFAKHGQVKSAKIIKDRETNKSKGFGFVEMETNGEQAMIALDGQEFQGRELKVNRARERKDKYPPKRATARA